ncbi:MAG: PQQ-binding-like beta-propeller repeat protein [Ignavibacteria bacterium]|jgi:outer membrane protein assembly factor BamB
MRYILLFFFIIQFTFAQGNLIWQKSSNELPANGYSWSTPLIMDHKLFWAGQDKAFAALDEATGDILWVDSVNFRNGTYDSPVGFEGKVFISRDSWSDPANKGLLALAAETGAIIWQKQNVTVSNRSSKPIDIVSKTIFVACTDTLYCLAIDDGTVVWSKAGKYSNLLIDYNGTKLFASRKDSAMIEVLSLGDGQQSWRLDLPDEKNSITGMAYTNYQSKEYLVLTPDWNWNVDTQYVYAIDVIAQNILWRSDLIGHTGNGVGPAIMGDKVFAGTQKTSSDTSQNIVAFNLLNGNIIWEKPARRSGLTNTPYVIALDGKVYYENTLNNDYSIVCADAETGNEIWTGKPDGEFEWWPISWGSPVLYDNKLFMPTDGDGIYCYNTGEVDGSWLMVSGNVYATNSYLPELVTNVKKVENAIPISYMLEQNYPNPFNPATTISFSIPEEGFVKLNIYNSIGQKITTLINENLQAGSYKTDFNAANHASGIYFYTLEVNGYSTSKKMILLK